MIAAPAVAGIVVTFYRSYLTAADADPVDALIRAFRAKGIAAQGLFVPSLKAPEAVVGSHGLFGAG